ncbi:mCG147486 [Mus musculus]|nr:mCG147486 [Mus musculus]
MNIVEHVSFLSVGPSSGYMLRRGIAGFSGSTMSNFLRNCQTDFQSGCTSLQSHQQWRSVPLSPHPHQHLLSPEFLILAILTDVRWNPRFVLICISLMIKDVEHFFSGASLPFGIPQLRILCLALYPICNRAI